MPVMKVRILSKTSMIYAHRKIQSISKIQISSVGMKLSLLLNDRLINMCRQKKTVPVKQNQFKSSKKVI
jgi:hypothetical protein